MVTKTLSVASIAAILLTSLASAADPKVTIKEWGTKLKARFLTIPRCDLGRTNWYSESATKPNTVVRFDPTKKSFASWPIPSGGGVVCAALRPSDRSGLQIPIITRV